MFEQTKQKLKTIIKTYIPRPAIVIFAITIAAAMTHMASELSKPFADTANRTLGALIRGIFAKITGILPFSLAETIIVSIPILAVVAVVGGIKQINKSEKNGIRAIVSLAAVVAWMYSMFVFTTAVAYNGTSLAEKLGLEQKPVSVAELKVAAEYMIDELDKQLDDVDFRYAGSSVMPYSFEELNEKLIDAYDSFADKYDFIPRLSSRVKQVALSEAMTYTHMSGMYTYYTGEANININFPDYTIPYTMAHELAHQRGVLPENEANFVAFLVCVESDDPYIRYSGIANILEYINSAIYRADYDTFAELYGRLDVRFTCEQRAYNEFFEKYRENTAANVSSALNDTYLKAQGQSEGEKSYGMVVDLAVAWVESLQA